MEVFKSYLLPTLGEGDLLGVREDGVGGFESGDGDLCGD
jgi:hypothetical protein